MALMGDGALKWAWRQAASVRMRIVGACILGILRISTGLTFVWVSKLLVDAATSGSEVSTGYLVRLSVILASLMIVEMLFSLSVTYISNQTEINLKNRLRTRLFDHLMGTSHSAISDGHSADYVNRLTEDTRVLSEAMCKKLPDCIVFMVQFLAAFTMLYCMSAGLALCILGILPFFLILSKIYVMRTRRITKEVRATDSTIQTNIQEGLQHHVVVQTLECEGEMHNHLSALQSTLYGWTMQRTRLSVFSRAMLRLAFISCYLSAFLWSVWHLHTGVITYGTMTAFLQLVARIQNPMANMTQLIPSLVHSLTSIDRMSELQKLPLEGKSSPELLKKPVGIRLQDITFSYKPTAPKIFDHFSYDFAPASKTLIMGETGVGKSTLVRMLMALLTPQEGKATMYDSKTEVPISANTRCNIVYVPQGNSLFEGTVRENLQLADPEATEEMMLDALHTAVADFVTALPQGLDTRCGELGASLSEGQAQRIAIARALLRKGSVLILDEFNSALDATTASTLLQRLMAKRSDATIIFISHRPEVAAFCDATLHLDR